MTTAIVQPEPFAKDGIYPGVSRQEYERIDAINFSRLKHFRKTPAHAHEEILHPSKPTEAMELGTAFHVAILEPSRFDSEYVVPPKCDRRTTAGKQMWVSFESNNTGKSLLKSEDYDTIKEMQSAVFAHPLAAQLVSRGSRFELAVVWTDETTGLQCKALVDGVSQIGGQTIIWDAKTVDDAGEFFGTAVNRFAWHEQAAMYLAGFNALAKAHRQWQWIAVEKKRPFCVAVREPDEDTLATGYALFREHLMAYAECKKTNLWPGYSSASTPVRIPRYALLGDE